MAHRNIMDIFLGICHSYKEKIQKARHYHEEMASSHDASGAGVRAEYHRFCYMVSESITTFRTPRKHALTKLKEAIDLNYVPIDEAGDYHSKMSAIRECTNQRPLMVWHKFCSRFYFS